MQNRDNDKLQEAEEARLKKVEEDKLTPKVTKDSVEPKVTKKQLYELKKTDLSFLVCKPFKTFIIEKIGDFFYIKTKEGRKDFEKIQILKKSNYDILMENSKKTKG